MESVDGILLPPRQFFLYRGQDLRLHRYFLPFVALAQLAETHDRGAALAPGCEPAGKQGVARGHKLEVVHNQAAQAGGAGVPSSARRRRPRGIDGSSPASGRHHHQLARPLRFLDQPFALGLRKGRRDPVRAIGLFDRRIAVRGKAQRPPIGRA